ncbi:hypothetical protein GH714_022751 [Hevea brasiliensis]|uniref:GHMP kinase C-terminal domain-containing protein n=1 Tax=Hevea brasiliensis TaxID=3981 RepID=A0A6A6LD13_HEVBR|nr:hypothetical protein GH714_022751 [Hevea brasiliensis]
MAICFLSPAKPISISPLIYNKKPAVIRCNFSLPTITTTEPKPVFTSVRSFAPATVANLGPGFDFLGCAVDGLGDFVSVRIDPSVHPGEISISDICGTHASIKLSKNPLWNCAGIAAIATMKMLNIRRKGALFVLVSPDFEAPTKKMRAALPAEIGMPHHVWNCSQAGALVASVLQGDLVGLGQALSSDKIVEPKRAPLIPGMEEVKKAAMRAGAFGCTISGAGPTAVAVIDDEERGKEIGKSMVEAFSKEGNLKAVAMVKRLDRIGARIVGSVPTR